MPSLPTLHRAWPGATRALLRSAAVAGLLGSVALILLVTLRGPLKDDIAWLLYVSEQWLHGRRLYVDLVEVNPPLIVWLCAVPVELARFTGISQKLVAVTMFAATILGCTWWTASLLRGHGRAFADRLVSFSVIGSVLLLLPGGEFAQREHLLIAMALPYLALLGGEIGGWRAERWQTIAAGCVAAIGCALKPHYLLAFTGTELFAVYHGLRLFRPTTIAAAATLSAYALAAAILTPAYYTQAIPMALSLYRVTDTPILTLIGDCRFIMLALVAAAWLLVTSRDRKADLGMAVVIMFAAVSTVVCVIESKNWFYHRLPAAIAVVLGLLGLLYLRLLQDDPASSWRVRLSWRRLAPTAAAVVALLVFGFGAYGRLQPQINESFLDQPTVSARLADLIEREHAHSYMAFSEWIALGFPVVNNTGVVWASRFDSMWPLHDRIERKPKSGDDAAWPVADWVVADFLHTCPDIAVVDRRGQARYEALLSGAEPAFRRAWRLYHPIAAFSGIVVFRNKATHDQRRAAGCYAEQRTPVAKR